MCIDNEGDYSAALQVVQSSETRNEQLPGDDNQNILSWSWNS